MIKKRKEKKNYRCILSNPELFSDDELLDYAIKKYKIGDKIIYDDSFNESMGSRPGETYIIGMEPYFFDKVRRGIAGAGRGCVIFHPNHGWQKIIKKEGE